MARCGLGFALVVFALALALTSCVSPEELRREDEATSAGYGFHPGTDAFASCLQKEAWHAVIRFRYHLLIGAAVIGAGPGDRTGISERL